MILPLRIRILTILLSVVGFITVAQWGVGYFFILPQFVRLERREAANDLSRVMETLNHRGQALMHTCSDWATWDQAYQFAGDHNREFISRNLPRWKYSQLGVDLVHFYDRDGDLTWGEVRDRQTGEVRSLPGIGDRGIPDVQRLLQPSPTHEGTLGFLRVGDTALQVAMQPIMDSARQGPPRGTLVMGRLLPWGPSEELSRIARVPIALQPFWAAKDAVRAESAEQSPDGTVIEVTSPASLDALQVVFDLDGNPLVLMSATIPRTATNQAARAL
ncbi:MAG: CHASE4 domain-containing protein [Planctomycetota bacterium]